MHSDVETHIDATLAAIKAFDIKGHNFYNHFPLGSSSVAPGCYLERYAVLCGQKPNQWEKHILRRFKPKSREYAIAHDLVSRVADYNDQKHPICAEKAMRNLLVFLHAHG